MKGVILATEDGRKLGTENPKALIKLCGVSLLERNLHALKASSIKDIVVVLGSKGRMIREHLKDGAQLGLNMEYVDGGEYEGDITSLLAAEGLMGEQPFLLLRGDQVFDERILRELSKRQRMTLGIDSSYRPVDGEDAPKVWVENGKAKAIGKELKRWNSVYIGVALCDPRLFSALKRCPDKGREWFECLDDLAEQDALDCLDISKIPSYVPGMRRDVEPFWFRIDSKKDVERCKILLAERLPKERDGVVSRYLNRRLSIPLSLWLSSHSRITANQMSFISFGIATAAAGLFALGKPVPLVMGGVLAQLSSILDGCDGELARLRGTASAYGAWFDAALDRWADALLIAGMTYAAWNIHNASWVWGLGFLTLAGVFGISYTESRYKEAFGRPLPADRGLPAKRDSRLFLALLSGLTGQVTVALSLIAGLSIAEVVRRLWANAPGRRETL
ncbi:MAG: NTP transferase domain-containing protein [Anaerolineae bacterium]